MIDQLRRSENGFRSGSGPLASSVSVLATSKKDQENSGWSRVVRPLDGSILGPRFLKLYLGNGFCPMLPAVTQPDALDTGYLAKEQVKCSSRQGGRGAAGKKMAQGRAQSESCLSAVPQPYINSRLCSHAGTLSTSPSSQDPGPGQLSRGDASPSGKTELGSVSLVCVCFLHLVSSGVHAAIAVRGLFAFAWVSVVSRSVPLVWCLRRVQEKFQASHQA
ncbi:hypothetical protein B0T26DRAFT_708142 [Lasiosphaeria miniovina]|uniref:Uncharacterized protein n=1 Tax=Lasiosphaeria miniovina TaxID=1954250 RepID=A0AA40DXA4_9PEZI|nr:uncharacterized protein B0T26DRAFT_708142 [Lasiosphaeria miniovina]KAK0717022.1 hypothetical protein B0T26DRAFT_708142 [Lasiosphaeria miniovina]